MTRGLDPDEVKPARPEAKKLWDALQALAVAAARA